LQAKSIASLAYRQFSVSPVLNLFSQERGRKLGVPVGVKSCTYGLQRPGKHPSEAPVRIGGLSGSNPDASECEGKSGTLIAVAGITPPDQDIARAAPNHSPLWRVDEAGMLPGLRSLLHLVADYTGSG
jgi:hypothetical protein